MLWFKYIFVYFSGIIFLLFIIILIYKQIHIITWEEDFMQLVAYGAQDIYLTGNPQITFWKVVYRRHTNFARESIEQTIKWIQHFN